MAGTTVQPGAKQLADAVLDIAAEVDAAEERLKRAVLEAARAGDCERVVQIVETWLANPPVEAATSALLDASPSR